MKRKLEDRLKINIELYQKMYLIRQAEDKACEHYPSDDMKTPLHLSIGEEAISAGVCAALKEGDQVFGTYRSHGIYLAIADETDKFFAELYGKATGLAKGKAGSMHLSAPEAGFLGASSIVASIIPLAVGAAFANKRSGNNKVATVFFGDGAMEEGVFWESINAACLMRLPVMFICEDNELAVHTHRKYRQGYNSIIDIISKFNCNTFEDITTDVEIIYETASRARESALSSRKPSFLRFGYYRYKEHVGINEDFECGYRSREDFEKWFKKDPIQIQREKLLRLGCLEEEVREKEALIDKKIETSIKLAEKAPFPGDEELFKDLYFSTLDPA